MGLRWTNSHGVDISEEARSDEATDGRTIRWRDTMNRWYWWAMWLVSAIGVWALPRGFLYAGFWFLAWLGIALVVRHWERRTTGSSR